MASKNDTKVLIGGSVYTLSGDESEEYLQRVALYINNKMEELKESANGQRLNTRLQSVLLTINIADDLFKTKQDYSLLEKENDALKKELEKTKQELKEYIEIFEEQ